MTTGREVASADRSRDAGAAVRVGAGIFLSRVFGFARGRAEAYFLGTTDFADAWRAALRLPNVLQNLLGEGTLSASLIPVYAEFRAHGRDEDARRFAGAALGILTVLAAGLVVAGILLAPVLVGLFFSAWTPEKRTLTVRLVRILFPMTGVLVLAAWALAILNSHRRFFVSYVAPVLWNIAIVSGLVGAGAYMALPEGDIVIAAAWGALAGGFLQLAIQVPFVLKHLGRFRVSLGSGVAGVQEAVRSFGPVVAARGVVNLSGWVDLILAGRLANGAVALMTYAQTFYVLPISLFGMSVAASELPELSRMRGESGRVLAGRVSAALRRVSYFLVPSAIGYLAVGDVAIAALYETGAFGTAQSLVTWGVLAAYALGLPATASSRVLSSAFYALRDTRTPARIAGLRVLVSASLGVALMFPLDRLGLSDLRLGAAGLALGSSASAWLELLLLRRALGRLIGSHGPGSGPVVRQGLAATVAAAAAIGLQVGLPPTHPFVLGLETLIPFGVVYLAAATALGEPLKMSARAR